MGIVSGVGLVFDVRGGDCDTTLPLFWGFIDGAILEKAGIALLSLSLCNGCCKSSLGLVRVDHAQD